MVYPTIPEPNGQGEVSRLLSAALVDERFCQLLLTNPNEAITEGYNGQQFHFSEAQRVRMSSLRANSLSAWTKLLMNGHVA